MNTIKQYISSFCTKKYLLTNLVCTELFSSVSYCAQCMKSLGTTKLIIYLPDLFEFLWSFVAHHVFNND